MAKENGPDGAPLPGDETQPELELTPPAASDTRPANDFGVAEPTDNSPDSWLKYDEAVYKARETREAEQRAKKEADEKAAAPAAAATPEAKPEAKPAAEVKGAKTETPSAAAAAETKGESGDDIDKLDPPARAEAPTSHKALDPEEKFALADGIEWKRADVISGLNNGRQWQQEAQTFRELFGYNAENAAKAWAPWLKDLRENPNLGPALDRAKADYLESKDDPEYEAFMQSNRDRWKAWRSTPEGQTSAPVARRAEPPGVDPEIAQRIKTLEDQLSEERQSKSREALTSTIRAEEGRLKGQYAFLNDRDIWEYVWRHAVAVGQEQARQNNGVSSYTLTDAVRDKWSTITKWAKAGTTAPTAGSKVETPPALRSSSSSVAAAAGAGRKANSEEKVFGSADEAAADWLKQHPNGYEE